MISYISKREKSKTAVAANYSERIGNAITLQDNRPSSVAQRKQVEAMAERIPVQRKSNNTGLPDSLKSGVESLSGYSMDDVKVHYNSGKPAQLKAHAYAQGTDIHIAPGQEKHLPHEAWHVVQQKQGRVKPTLQMQGKAVNDNNALEKEADKMGSEVLEATNTEQPAQLLKMPCSLVSPVPVLQARFISLSEERIMAIQEAAAANGNNLDAEYLQGLYIREADAENNNPGLFFRVMRLPKPYFTRNNADALAPNIMLYAEADAANNAEQREEALSHSEEPVERLNVLQILSTETEYWDEDEHGPITGAQIRDNADVVVGNGEGERQINDLVTKVLTGGLEEDQAGGYGSIEFRFKATRGLLYMSEDIDVEQVGALHEPYPDLEIKQESPDLIEAMIHIYVAAGLPYADTRTDPSGLFIEQSLRGAFLNAMQQYIGDEQITGRQALTPAQPSEAPLPPAPIVVPKVRQRNYTFRATRGSRNAGQSAAMNNFSARNYVARFNAQEAQDYSWEWLHIQGSRLGGPNRPENLVAGTFDANTQMIPYERSIFELSSVASNEHPVQVTWTATVLQDPNGNNTHIGDTITMSVNFPNGAPEETEHVKPQSIAHLFPIAVKVTEGADFTKMDRDAVEREKSMTQEELAEL